MATATILAGNTCRIVSTLTALDTPAGAPTATVCITDARGELVGTLTEAVELDGLEVTVTADWAVPDTQAGGIYIATIDTTGSLIAADEIRFRVTPRIHSDPHVP